MSQLLYTGPHTHDFTTGTCACGAQCDHKTIDMTTGKCAACSKQLYQAKIGTTGYAIRIQEDKSGQLIELHADGEEVLADIPESTLDNFAYTLNDDLGNMR